MNTDTKTTKYYQVNSTMYKIIIHHIKWDLFHSGKAGSTFDNILM